MPTIKSFLEISQFEINHYERLFSMADSLNVNPLITKKVQPGSTAALIFFESSTRTRMSFETACVQAGLAPILFDIKSGSSLDKGESFEDTILNVAAMDPSVMVVRCGDGLDLRAMDQQVKVPLLNAGWGKKGHPTQAILDAYTIRQFRKQIKGEKLLLVGDIVHSRVASSHFELAKILGYQVALCGPKEFMPSHRSDFIFFDNLSEGLRWANVVMALRVQTERHDSQYSIENYKKDFGLNINSLRSLSEDSLVMHPGPINHGFELESEVLQDRRCVVLDQVRCGVKVRRALIHMALEGFKC